MAIAKRCGACSVCCKDLMFEMDGALKLAGVMCPHATPPHGCGIHDCRPSVCRTYFCGWYYLPSLDEEWRPDQSEVLISLRAPDGLTDGIEFMLLGSPEKLSWLPLVRYIATLIVDGAPVYLALPGEPGYQSPWVYLSDIAALKDAIARRDLDATTAALKAALQICRDYPKTALPQGLV
ncbi:MAG: hypothetical protein P4L57_00935 [Rhizomicrobium sp.]|nr:hypothetical protein [Rhizomicrobium sp.]